jgi:hypothetical protein
MYKLFLRCALVPVTESLIRRFPTKTMAIAVRCDAVILSYETKRRLHTVK